LDPNTGRPYRIQGDTQRFGSISTWGAVEIGGHVYFIGGSSQGGPIAYRIDGPIPTRISTHAEEAAWNEAGLGPGVVAYAYQEEGHTFIVWNFGTQAYAWDETEKRWHRRMSWDGTQFQPYETKYHAYITEWGNQHITCGDTLGGNVYVSSVEFYDDNGSDIAWRRALPYRYNGGNTIFFGRQDLEMETGTVASGPEPVITRDYSDDRGRTFKNPQNAGTGTSGDGTRRVFWLAGGSSRGRVWRYFGEGQSKVALIDLQGEETKGTA
jgi:hypothetical protein